MRTSDYKARARMALKGFYMPFVLARLLFYLATMLIATFSGNVYSYGLMYGLSGASFNYGMVSGSVIFGLAMDILIMVLGWIFAFGYFRMGLRRNRGEVVDISMVFDGFKPGQKPWKLVGASALISILSFVIVFIPLIMLIAGSFVVAYLNLSFALSFFIILDHPDISITGALKQSFAMMRGRRFKLIWLVVFSFFGWHILNLFTFGLLSMWLEPYILSSVIQFYMDVNGEYATYSSAGYANAGYGNANAGYGNSAYGNSSYGNANAGYGNVRPSYGETGELVVSDRGADESGARAYEPDRHDFSEPEVPADSSESKETRVDDTRVDDTRADGYESGTAAEGVTYLNGEAVGKESHKPEESKAKEENKSKSFEELMEELYKENKLKNDNYFGKGDRN